MPHQHNDSYIVNMKGGKGGAGGLGGQQGGNGGVGEGPRLYLDADIMHIVIHRGGREEEIDITRRDFLDWLSPLNFFPRQQDISEVRVKGTGEWLLEHPIFQQWESESGRTLWCRGIPGAGKTVLASMVVDYLGTQFTGKNIGVACIYLNHKEVGSQTPSRLLAGLWRQLVLDRDIGSIAENLYRQHREKGTAPLLEDIVNVLSSSLKEFSQVFVIVDALDEYPEFERLILLRHLAAIGSNVNLMITSRPHISLEPFSLPDLKILDIQATPDDLREYINAQICSSRLSQHIEGLPELQEEIHAKIIGVVDGMFLLAKLHVESLKTKNTIKAVRKALTELPKNLYEGYDIAIQRIEAQNEQDRETAHSTLMWVANAKRPLSVEELRVALAVEPGTQQLDKENLLKIEIILGVCAGLVIADEKRKVVRLVHYTTQEYLDSIQAQKFPDAQTEITRTLLTYLAFDGYPDQSWKSWNLPPLAEYSQYCLAHAVGQPEVQLRKSLLEFLGRAFQWINALNKGRWNYQWNSLPWNSSHQPSQPSALWIAVAANLVKTTEFLLERVADVNATGGEGSLLQIAVAQGHTEIVHILLDKGAEFGSMLHTAAHKGHTEIVHILVEQGADVNVAGRQYGSALQAAITGGNTEIIHFLLENGANVNTVGGQCGSALHAAITRGHAKIVHILVEKGANVNAAKGPYGSSLHAAIAKGHTEIVCILVEKGVDVNAAGGPYGSSLHAAIAKGHTEIVRILVEKGADINAVWGPHGSSLNAAIAKGHTETVGILLEKGANVNAAGGRYGSSLQAAAAGGHTEIISLLLERGARFPVPDAQ